MNATETAAVLAVLSGAYPSTEITDEVAELWANVFASEAHEAIVFAARQWIETERFWPTPADLRKIIREARRREEMETPPEDRVLPAPEPPPEIEPGTGVVLSSTRPPATLDDAIDIAYRAYCREVVGQGREPRSRESFARQMPTYGYRKGLSGGD